MKTGDTLTSLCFTLLCLFPAGGAAGFVEPLDDVTALRSWAESETRLPCRYQVESPERAVQVTWFKELPDQSREQIITAHYTDGHTAFGPYSGRVRFESSRPTEDSTLLILSTLEADEGVFTCRVTLYPSGSFERSYQLTVWVLPITSLELMVLTEGQAFTQAASCRSVARPPPGLSWDTELPGRSQNRSSSGGGASSVSSQFLLHPLRSMDGRRLDCLVWHPGLQRPHRLEGRLVVQYPPDAMISAGTDRWVVGLTDAEMTCTGGGQPPADTFTWNWRGGALPDGVTATGGQLVFGRALRMNDTGVFECMAKNIVGTTRSEFLLNVADASRRIEESSSLLLLVVGGAAGGLVLLMALVVLLVCRNHRRHRKKLQRELSQRTEEVNTLSRQASFRRLNSVSTDPRVQSEDYALLRVDSRMKHSQMSLERPAYRSSQSTLCGKWPPAGGLDVDELGRPVVWHDGRGSARGADVDTEREECRRRVESYLKSSSNMSLDSGLPSSLVPLKPQQDEGQGGPCLAGPPGNGGWEPPHSPAGGGEEEEEEEDEDEEDSSYQISEALSNHFYLSKGVLRPKPHSNALLMQPRPRGQLI